MPKVTVIIPNYNHARYLPKRLESVLGQTFRDTEILFLDDASPDNSREVFAPYAADPRVRSIFNEKNSGSTFVQWNRGFREAKGEYIWIAESDDFAEESFLSDLVDVLDRNPRVGLAYCQSRVVDSEGNVVAPPTPGLGAGRWGVDFINDGRTECAEHLISGNTIPNASAVLLRRSVVEQVGPAPENFKAAGDWLMWGRMLMAADVAFLARPLNSFRTHGKTVRSKYWRSPQDLLESARVWKELVQSLGDRLTRARRIEVSRGLAWTWIASLENQPMPDRRALRCHLKVLGIIAYLDRRGISVVLQQGARQLVRGVGLERVARSLMARRTFGSSHSASVHPPGE